MSSAKSLFCQPNQFRQRRAKRSGDANERAESYVKLAGLDPRYPRSVRARKVTKLILCQAALQAALPDHVAQFYTQAHIRIWPAGC